MKKLISSLGKTLLVAFLFVTAIQWNVNIIFAETLGEYYYNNKLYTVVQCLGNYEDMIVISEEEAGGVREQIGFPHGYQNIVFDVDDKGYKGKQSSGVNHGFVRDYASDYKVTNIEVVCPFYFYVGSELTTKYYKVNDTVTYQPEAKANHLFDGWFTSENFDSQTYFDKGYVVKDTDVTNPTGYTLYAKYNEESVNALLSNADEITLTKTFDLDQASRYVKYLGSEDDEAVEFIYDNDGGDFKTVSYIDNVLSNETKSLAKINDDIGNDYEIYYCGTCTSTNYNITLNFLNTAQESCISVNKTEALGNEEVEIEAGLYEENEAYYVPYRLKVIDSKGTRYLYEKVALPDFTAKYKYNMVNSDVVFEVEYIHSYYTSPITELTDFIATSLISSDNINELSKIYDLENNFMVQSGDNRSLFIVYEQDNETGLVKTYPKLNMINNEYSIEELLEAIDNGNAIITLGSAVTFGEYLFEANDIQYSYLNRVLKKTDAYDTIYMNGNRYLNPENIDRYYDISKRCFDLNGGTIVALQEGVKNVFYGNDIDVENAKIEVEDYESPLFVGEEGYPIFDLCLDKIRFYAGSIIITQYAGDIEFEDSEIPAIKIESDINELGDIAIYNSTIYSYDQPAIHAYREVYLENNNIAGDIVAEEDGIIEIESGNYDGALIEKNGGTIIVEGGTFRDDPSKYLAEDCVVIPYKIGIFNYYVINLDECEDGDIIETIYTANKLEGDSKDIFDYYMESLENEYGSDYLEDVLKEEFLVNLYSNYKTTNYDKIIFVPYVKLIAEKGNLNSEDGWLQFDYSIYIDVYGAKDDSFVKLTTDPILVTEEDIVGNDYFTLRLPTCGLNIEKINHIHGNTTSEMIEDENYYIEDCLEVELYNCSKLIINPDSTLPNDSDTPINNDDSDNDTVEYQIVNTGVR